MHYSRRNALRTLAGSLSLAAASPLLLANDSVKPNEATASGPKRIVFFLQNHNFFPHSCIPDGIKESGSLAKIKLAEPMAALQSYTDRMHVISLHGTHTNPNHSAYFGALGGYRGGSRGAIPPNGPTIDYVLSNMLPPTVLPHLCIGMDTLESMTIKPTVATLSAQGVGMPIYMQSNPNLLYQMIFGGIAQGNLSKEHEAVSNMFEQIEKMAATNFTTLPPGSLQRYQQFVQGFNDSNGLRKRLASVADQLKNLRQQ